jgi:general secretion pathway protein F
MPVYVYSATDDTEKVRNGVIEAQDAREARLKIRSRNLFLLDLQPATESEGSAEPVGLLERILSGRRGDEMAIVTRQFATLLRGGVPLTDALEALVEQVDSKNLGMVLRDVRDRVTQGMSLRDALAAHRNYFDRFYINMVEVGEATGHLDEVLNRLSLYLQSRKRTKGKVTSAMVYPLVMIAVGTLVVAFLMTFVVPKITGVLVSSGRVLPLPTMVMIEISDFISGFWWLVVGGTFAGFLAYRFFVRSEQGRWIVDSLWLRAPLIGPLLHKHVVARFSLALATLLRSGVPALEALGIVRRIMDNAVLNRTLEEIHDRILEGEDISGPVKRSRVFPPLVGYMIAIGEQSGNLEEMLELIAGHYEEEVETSTQRLTSLLEPALIVGMAVVVGFIVLSIALPILELTNIS